MATAKNSRQRARPMWLKILLVLAVLAVAAFWYWHEPIAGLSRTGASYGARMACSCRYVAGRDIKDCKKDFEPGMEMVFLSDEPDEKAVTAYVPLIASETASYRKGYGCMLEPWDE